jgi:hypothetical protein
MKRKIFYNIEQNKIGFEPTESVSTSKNKQVGLRVKIKYDSEDLIIASKGSGFYCFGIKEDTYYNMPLYINTKNEENKNFCSNINSIYEECKSYVFKNRTELGIKINEEEEMENIFKNPLSETSSETLKLYPKLIVSKNNNDKIWTIFFEKEDEENDFKPCDFESLINVNQHMHIYPTILFDSIYINKPGSNQPQISLQYKISEAIIKRKKQNIIKPSLEHEFVKNFLNENT